MKSYKPTGDRNRLIFRWWEELFLIVTMAVWLVLLVAYVLSGYQETAADTNAMTAFLLAVVFIAVIPPLAPPMATVPLLVVLLCENHKRRKRRAAVQESPENTPA